MGITVGAGEAAPGVLQSWCSHTPAPVAGERRLLLTREGWSVPRDCCQRGIRRTPLCMSLLWQVSVIPLIHEEEEGVERGRQGREFRAAAVQPFELILWTKVCQVCFKKQQCMSK